jgi:hypothetical protein
VLGATGLGEHRMRGAACAMAALRHLRTKAHRPSTPCVVSLVQSLVAPGSSTLLLCLQHVPARIVIPLLRALRCPSPHQPTRWSSAALLGAPALTFRT